MRTKRLRRLTRAEEAQLLEAARYGLLDESRGGREPEEAEVKQFARVLRVFAQRRVLGYSTPPVQDLGKPILPERILPRERLPPKEPSALKTAAVLAITFRTIGREMAMKIARATAGDIVAKKRAALKAQKRRLR